MQHVDWKIINGRYLVDPQGFTTFSPEGYTTIVCVWEGGGESKNDFVEAYFDTKEQAEATLPDMIELCKIKASNPA